MTTQAVAAGGGQRVPWQVKYAALVVMWGSSFLLMMVALRHFTAWQIVTWRILLAAGTLVALLAMSGGRLPRDRRTLLHLVVCGFFLAALPFTCFVWAETRIASALAGIANATTPISTVLALVALMGERIGVRRLVAVLAGFAGVVLIAHPWDVVGRPDLLGLGVGIVGGLSYGVGWTYNRRFLADADLGGLAQPTALMVSGAVQILPVGLVAWWLNRDAQPLPWSVTAATGATDTGGGPVWLSLLCIVALAVLNTGIAYVLQYDVVRAAGPMITSTMTYLIPVVSVVIGVVVLGEHLSWWQVLGFAVVLAAALVINTAPRRAE